MTTTKQLDNHNQNHDHDKKTAMNLSFQQQLMTQVDLLCSVLVFCMDKDSERRQQREITNFVEESLTMIVKTCDNEPTLPFFDLLFAICLCNVWKIFVSHLFPTKCKMIASNVMVGRPESNPNRERCAAHTDSGPAQAHQDCQ